MIVPLWGPTHHTLRTHTKQDLHCKLNQNGSGGVSELPQIGIYTKKGGKGCAQGSNREGRGFKDLGLRLLYIHACRDGKGGKDVFLHVLLLPFHFCTTIV